MDKAVAVTKKAPTFLERLADRWAAIDVHGRVVDQEGKPLPGATVKVKGTGKSVSTNGKGEFYLEKVEEDVVLVVSFIGYVSKEVDASKQMGNIVLELSDSKLDEVQVIAYGTTTQRLSTGNISTVKAEDIAKAPVQNPLLALQGRIPGIIVEQSRGYANAGVKVLVQGKNSISKGNDPLYVIDGVPFVSQLLPTLNDGILGPSGDGGSGGNPLSFLSPYDIESIAVLKDADATSIYGSRAANGAILITTKKGKSGETKVDANIQTGWGSVSRKLKLLNTPQYLNMRLEAKKNDNTVPSDGQYGDVDLLYYSHDSYTDWQKELIGGIAKQFDARSSVSGGTSTIQYLFGGAYHRETSVLPNDLSDQKTSFHLNINTTSKNQRFRIQLRTNYMHDVNVLPTADLTESAMRLPPNSPALYTKDGKLNWGVVTSGESTFKTWENPLGALINKYRLTTTNLITNASLSYLIVPGLNFKSDFGYTKLQIKEVSIFPIGQNPLYLIPRLTRSSSFADNSINSYSIEPQINYQKTLGKSNMEILVGSTIYQNDRNGQILNAQGFTSDYILEDIMSANVVTVSNSIIAKYKYNALFGRINYNWDGKYIISLNARRDGTSRFGTENRFHNFGSVAGAWVFSNENFVKNNVPGISFGKIRASYGTTGNDQIDDYAYLSLYNTVYDQGMPYQGVKGLEPVSHSNPYLQWEETRKFQLVVDIGVASDRLILTLNYNRNHSTNQLLRSSLPAMTGFESIAANLPATVRNTGLELTLNAGIIKHQYFNWSSNLNITIPRNRLVSFPNLSTSTSANTLLIGESINIIRLYDLKGVNPTTGLYEFVKRDGSISSTPNNPIDKTILLNPDPKFYGGLNNSFSYKEFSLDFLLQFVKQKGKNYYLGPALPGQVTTNQPDYVLNHWGKVGDMAAQQRYNADFSTIRQYSSANNSEIVWSDASYIRLKNLSISWQLSDNWKDKLKLKNVRLYVQGQNLLTITSYKGLDPETKFSTVLPPLRVISMGINITL